MSTSSTVLKLRKQWFRLQAINFIKRYATGLVVIAIFLPGVAIGDNFSILMTAVTKPFVLISQGQEGFFNRLFYLVILQAVFIVWARAQQLAINGGGFMRYVKTLPLANKTSRRHDVILLLIANHLLWPIVIYGFFFLMNNDNEPQMDSIIRYGYLVSLLLLTQYISLFALNKSNVILIVVLNIGLLFISSWPLLWLVVLIFAYYLTSRRLHKADPIVQGPYMLLSVRLIPRFLSDNLHYQMLFKSNHTQVLFRLSLMVMLMIGFVLISDHIKVISHDNLMPYLLALEALLAYYLSGFYVTFRDERQCLSSLLMSLPVHPLYWPIRDILAIVAVSVSIHVVFVYWLFVHVGVDQALFVMTYHLILLMICYPLRKLKDDKQTLIAFVVLFIITAVSIYHLP